MGKRKGKGRLHIGSVAVGIYLVLLGSSLALAGLSRITGRLGLARLVVGLVIICFGVCKVWDGVRDFPWPRKKPKVPSQFILIDISGNRTSNVTPKILREQVNSLVGSRDYKSFSLHVLPPLPTGGHGLLKQVACVCQYHMIMVAFLEMPQGGHRIYQKSMEPDLAVEWLGLLLTGWIDFSGWESIEPDGGQDGAAFFLRRFLAGQEGLAYRHQLLVTIGENGYDEYHFFSKRDLGFAVEGLQDGKYQKAVLEWGDEAFSIFPGGQGSLKVVWCTDASGKGNPLFMEREGSAEQVKAWLVHYLDDGYFERTGGWEDITGQVEQEWKKQGGRDKGWRRR